MEPLSSELRSQRPSQGPEALGEECLQGCRRVFPWPALVVSCHRSSECAAPSVWVTCSVAGHSGHLGQRNQSNGIAELRQVEGRGSVGSVLPNLNGMCQGTCRKGRRRKVPTSPSRFCGKPERWKNLTASMPPIMPSLSSSASRNHCSYRMLILRPGPTAMLPLEAAPTA
jgi:hypothetical protein